MKTTTKMVPIQTKSRNINVCQKSGCFEIVSMLEGRLTMMPAMMISEAPFPTPYSVISSPIHITSRAPATRDETTMNAIARGCPAICGSTMPGVPRNTPV